MWFWINDDKGFAEIMPSCSTLWISEYDYADSDDCNGIVYVGY